MSKTGPCTVSGHLPCNISFIGQEAKIVLNVNNAQCKKMVKKVQLKIHRKIVAKAIDMQGQQKEWTDDQVVLAGEF